MKQSFFFQDQPGPSFRSTTKSRNLLGNNINKKDYNKNIYTKDSREKNNLKEFLDLEMYLMKIDFGRGPIIHGGQSHGFVNVIHCL